MTWYRRQINFHHVNVTDYGRWRKYYFQWHKWNVTEVHVCCCDCNIYELLSQLDIVAIYTIATKIFRYTSAWLHRTYVVAKLVIAMLALVSATTMVVASTTHCHAERDCNTPQLSQLNTIWCNRLLPLRYKQPRSLSQRSQFCCVSSILNRKWAYCDDFWALGYEIFLVVLAYLDVWLVFVWIFFWLNNISKANMPSFLLHWASHKPD
jgi:hypothetical protein